MNPRYRFEFTDRVYQQLQDFSQDIQERILGKLRFWQEQKHPLSFSKPIHDFFNATHRFRIGKYRVICKVEKEAIVIIKIGLRDKIYKR